MNYELEQGVYYTASRFFESTTGLGLTASSSWNPKALREMRRVASLTDFCEEQTRYSFLYSSELGFCMTAATARHSGDDTRLTPYVHMVFSGRHPGDPPDEYAFSAAFQTGGQVLDGQVPRLAAEALPPWEPFARNTSIPQLAWLIQQLWAVLSAPNEGGSLVLSPDGFPPEWDAPRCLAQTARMLAGLVPPSLRENMRATTAPLSGKSRLSFKIFLGPGRSAVRLDRLPELVPGEDDYFGELVTKMARSYLQNRDEFHALISQVEQEALSKLQAGPQRMALAACCAATVPPSAWALQDQKLSAAYDRVRDMLRNENTDRPFWEEQAEKLRRITPPKELRDLLKWLRETRVPQEKFAEYLFVCYNHSPERFFTQFTQIDPEDRKILAAIWRWDKAAVIMKALLPVKGETPKEFYHSLCEQLRFWTPLLCGDARAAPAREYYSSLLPQAPGAAGLQDIEQLFRAPRDLLEREAQQAAVQQAVDRETCLPPMQTLESIPKEFINVPSIRDRLAALWRDKREAISSREQYGCWKSAGELLGVFDEQAEEKQVQQKITQVKTLQDAEDFAVKSLPYLDDRQLRDFCKKALSRLISGCRELDELKRLSAILERLPAASKVDWVEQLLNRKMDEAQLLELLRNGSLKELLRLTGDPKTREKLNSRQDMQDLWINRVNEFTGAARREGKPPVTLEDRDGIIQSACWLEGRRRQSLAESLCLSFLQSNAPSLEELQGTKRKECRSYNLAMEQYLEELAKNASLRELYEFAASGSGFRVAAPAGLWASMTEEGRMALLAGLTGGEVKKECLESILCEKEPFCKFLSRLCAPSPPLSPFEEDEQPLFLDCVASAVSSLPDSENTLRGLLEVWRRSDTEASEETCLELARRIGESCPPGKKNIRQALKIWQDVLRHTDFAPMLENAWEHAGRQGRRVALPQPLFQEDGLLQEALGEPEEPAGGTEPPLCAARRLESRLASIDQGVEKLFIGLSYIFRFPVKALIWLVQHYHF